MAFDFFRAIPRLEIRVRKRLPGETFLEGDPKKAGEWVVDYSSPRICATVTRTRPGMIEEIEAAGFEYSPRKRVYRRQ